MATVKRPPVTGYRPGRLVIVGSGIKSIAQFTLEAVAYIEQADKVFYCVADPASEIFIESLNKNARDLYDLYDDGKPRIQTYTQMSEIMLRDVRQGLLVVGVFYGHPGVFVNPSHRALAIVALEGYEGQMLPGVSAEDCLFADLGIDPSRQGCQTLEATDLILRDRTLATDCHVILFQVGSVGDLGFNFTGFTDTKFAVLVQRLSRDYGPEHELIHYVAAQLSIAEPVRERYQIQELNKPEVEKRVTGISTFYIPPKVVRGASREQATALGIRLLSDKPVSAGPFPSGMPYTEREVAFVKALDEHRTPKNYKKTRNSPEFYKALKMLAIEPQALTQFDASPSKFVAQFPDLTKREVNAILRRHSGMVRMALKRSADDVAADFAKLILTATSDARQWATVLNQNLRQQSGEANIIAYLKSRGYDTTPGMYI